MFSILNNRPYKKVMPSFALDASNALLHLFKQISHAFKLKPDTDTEQVVSYICHWLATWPQPPTLS